MAKAKSSQSLFGLKNFLDISFHMFSSNKFLPDGHTNIEVEHHEERDEEKDQWRQLKKKIGNF